MFLSHDDKLVSEAGERSTSLSHVAGNALKPDTHTEAVGNNGFREQRPDSTLGVIGVMEGIWPEERINNNRNKFTIKTKGPKFGLLKCRRMFLH